MDFYARVHIVCCAVPAGHAASYGQIAILCGAPGHARQVGYALRSDRAGRVPAHRIVNRRGILSGADAFVAKDLQKTLLESEGVPLNRTKLGWQVDMKIYGWYPSEEEQQRLRAAFEEAGI